MNNGGLKLTHHLTVSPRAASSEGSFSRRRSLRTRGLYLFGGVPLGRGSPLGALATGWLVTQVGSAPVVLILNGTALTLVALYFLVRGHGLKDI